MNRYRFFVSYRSNDRQIAMRVAELFQELGHKVFWDIELEAGKEFCKQIQQKIQQADFFVPVMTSSTWKSTWVQQEIGYAVACNVPVTAVVFGTLPKELGMIGQMQAIVVSGQISKIDLKSKLLRQDWASLQGEAQQRSTAVFQCDGDAKAKSKLIEVSARHIYEQFGFAKIMQRSTLTSFSLPFTFSDENWEAVKDKKKLFWLNIAERDVMEKLAKGGGCDLIIDPCYWQPGYRLDINKAKLKTLRKFFQETEKSWNLRVVLERFDRSESEIIIGDHWSVHSAAVATMATDRESISTWHAPTVRRHYERFQNEFEVMFNRQAKMRGNKNAVQTALDLINCKLQKLDRLHMGATEAPMRCIECALDFKDLSG